MVKRIAIQGFKGSFHEAAAKNYFDEVQVIPCTTFRDTIRIAANKKESDGGIMAIENSIAGSILPNYLLLQKSGLMITGEIYLEIRQCLLAKPGVTLQHIREVHSHPMALLQCMDFLEKYTWKLVETDDTALSAKYVHQSRSRHIAAIAGKSAAELYKLDILSSNIQTMKNNYTRFLVLQKAGRLTDKRNANKASVNFYTDHSKGSLARVLTKIAACGINLSKLQSMPIPGTEWKYSFHADMEFEDQEQFHKAIKQITPLTEAVKIYGLYEKGKTI